MSKFIKWNFKYNDNIIIGITDNFEYNPNIILLELENVIIERAKKYIDINEYNWKYKFDRKIIEEKISEIIKKNGSIVFLQTIQKNKISNYSNLFKLYIDILNKLKIEAIIIISHLKNTYYDKPYTGLYSILSDIYLKNKKKIQKKKSILIGNKAGRIQTRNYKYYDYNCHDRAFANNIGFSFVTSEDFFLGIYHNFYWNWNPNLPDSDEIKKYKKKSKEYSIDIMVGQLKKYVVPNENNLIICYGPPLFEKKIFCDALSILLSKIFKITPWNQNFNHNINSYKIRIHCTKYLKKNELDNYINTKNKIILIKFDISIKMANLLNNVYIELKKNINLKKM